MSNDTTPDVQLEKIFSDHAKDLPYGSHMTNFGSCDYCRDKLLQLITAETERSNREARIDELKHFDSLTHSFMSTGNDFIYEYRQSAVDNRIKELSDEH